MKKLSLQYIAGLIDGEGYIALLPNRSRETTNKTFEPVVKIGMTGKEPLIIFEALKNQYGGLIETKNGLSKGGRIVNTYVLKSKMRVGILMEDIIEYLIVKKDQAILLKEFCDMPYCHPKSPKFDKSIITRRIAIYDKLKQLKRPQPLATTN